MGFCWVHQNVIPDHFRHCVMRFNRFNPHGLGMRMEERITQLKNQILSSLSLKSKWMERRRLSITSLRLPTIIDSSAILAHTWRKGEQTKQRQKVFKWVITSSVSQRDFSYNGWIIKSIRSSGSSCESVFTWNWKKFPGYWFSFRDFD